MATVNAAATNAAVRMTPTPPATPALDSRLPAGERARMIRDLELALVIMADDWKLSVEWLEEQQRKVRGYSDFYLLHMWHTYRQR